MVLGYRDDTRRGSQELAALKPRENWESVRFYAGLKTLRVTFLQTLKTLRTANLENCAALLAVDIPAC